MGQACRERIAWIDASRGIAIILIVMFHSFLDANILSPQPEGLRDITYVLALMRLPAFFLLAGIVTGPLLDRRWPSFAKSRLATPVWLILVWTILSFAFERSGILLTGRIESPSLAIGELFWVPYGNLWFLYVLVLVALIARALRGMPLAGQIISTALLMLLFNKLYTLELPAMVAWAFVCTSVKALPFFMIGLWMRDAVLKVMNPGRRFYGTFVAGVMMGSCAVAAAFSTLTEPTSVLVVVGVSAGLLCGFFPLVALLSRSEVAAKSLGWIGRRSAGIFVSHQFFIGLLVAAEPLSLGLEGLGLWAFITLVATIGPLILWEASRALSLSWLFSPPGWFVSGLCRTSFPWRSDSPEKVT